MTFIVKAYIRGTDIADEYAELDAAIARASFLDSPYVGIEYLAGDGKLYNINWSLADT